MNKYFLTIDNGGTNTKAIIFDQNGNQIGSETFPTMRIEKRSGFHEIDLSELWTAISGAVKKVIKKSGLDASQIVGVSCVGHGKGLYALDHDKQVFMNGILSTDSRAVQLAEQFEKKVAKIYPISYQHVMESQSPVLLRWLKENDRQTYDRIGVILAAKDYVRYRLTGKVFQEYGDASGNNVINLDSQKYDQRLFDFFGISEMFDKMPPLKSFSDRCGVITHQAAKETGLTEGTPVFGGMFDIDACSIATGVLKDDYFSVIAGTWSINVFPSAHRAVFESGLMNSLYPTGQTLIEASSATSAGNLAMTIKSLMSEEEKNAKAQGKSIYDILEDFLEHTDASFSKVIFFPFLYGSNVNPDAEGAYIGVQSNTTKSAMVRAVYEGIAFAHRYHIEKLIKVLGHKPKAIRISGGGTNSKAWMQMFANILGMRIETVKATELGGLGGAIGTTLGLNVYPDLTQAVSKMVHSSIGFEPQSSQEKIYEQKYQLYLKLLGALDENWPALRNMQERIEL